MSDLADRGRTAQPPQSRRQVDVAAVEDLYRKILEALGEDPDRDGLRDTPRRVAAWWREFLDFDAGRCDTVFAHTMREGHQHVTVAGIVTWSLCEHHLLPFRVEFSCGYVPHETVVGLSKIVRIVQAHAHRLQLQERLTRQIATSLAEVTGSRDVGVWGRGEHLCMSMRGVLAQAARTDTNCLLGRLSTDPVLAAHLAPPVCREQR